MIKKQTYPSEHEEQVLLFNWIRRQPELKNLVFAIPNGGQRNIIVAKKLKDEGVLKGVPDIFVAIASGNYHGLFIELKKQKGGRVTDAQKFMLSLLAEKGYYSAVCNGNKAAQQLIKDYLEGNL